VGSQAGRWCRCTRRGGSCRSPPAPTMAAAARKARLPRHADAAAPPGGCSSGTATRVKGFGRYLPTPSLNPPSATTTSAGTSTQREGAGASGDAVPFAYSGPARLSQAQLTSLLAVLDTASEQLPGLLAPPPLTQLLGSAPTRAAGGSGAAAAAAVGGTGAAATAATAAPAAPAAAAAAAAAAAGGKGGESSGSTVVRHQSAQPAGMASAARARADASRAAGSGSGAWRRRLGAVMGGVARGAALLALAALPLLGARTTTTTTTTNGAPTTTSTAAVVSGQQVGVWGSGHARGTGSRDRPTQPPMHAAVTRPPLPPPEALTYALPLPPPSHRPRPLRA
jgi:hypothetical protein